MIGWSASRSITRACRHIMGVFTGRITIRRNVWFPSLFVPACLCLPTELHCPSPLRILPGDYLAFLEPGRFEPTLKSNLSGGIYEYPFCLQACPHLRRC